MNNNEMTNDMNIVGEVIENICYKNAIKYFGIE